VRVFEPRYKLWSDGASKRRWIYLPPGEVIDTSDMDHWVYPVGTKAWKEFTSGATRVETRFLHKVTATSWVMIAYRWRSDGSDADAVPAGAEDANGTQHDIPSRSACLRCHGGMADVLLGFSAIQLSHELTGLSLQGLIDEDGLSDPPSTSFAIPGDELARDALGYLHANCGHCHNPLSSVYASLKSRTPFTGGPRFWEIVGALDSVEQTEGYASTIGQPNSIFPDLPIIEPHDPSHSEMILRMEVRGKGSIQMPPLATEIVDDAGLGLIEAWITSLPAADGGVEPDAGDDAGIDEDASL
jgi:hypothetical protein